MCEHKSHQTIQVQTDIGPMVIFDTAKYEDVEGYCTGKEVCSFNLEHSHFWEDVETALFREILESGDRNSLVIDFGCNVGWYSLIAAQLGYRVIAIDSVQENLDNLNKTAEIHGLTEKIKTVCLMVGQDMSYAFPDDNIELVKMDLEGVEEYAVGSIEKQIADGGVNNILIEVSPVFNGSYPALLEKLKNYGLSGFELDKTPFNYQYNFNQTNLWYKK